MAARNADFARFAVSASSFAARIACSAARRRAICAFNDTAQQCAKDHLRTPSFPLAFRVFDEHPAAADGIEFGRLYMFDRVVHDREQHGLVARDDKAVLHGLIRESASNNELVAIRIADRIVGEGHVDDGGIRFAVYHGIELPIDRRRLDDVHRGHALAQRAHQRVIAPQRNAFARKRTRITKRLGTRPRQDHKHALAVRFARLWRDLPRTQSISDQACAAIVKVTGDAFYRTTQAAFEAKARQCADSGKHIDCKTSRLST